MDDYIKRILTSRVYEVVDESPLDELPRLSTRLKRRAFLKREDLHSVFSFKIRGAYNRIANIPEDLRRQGVICASAGNHAQGVALSAERLGIRATIVMPTTTPSIKVEAVRKLGGRTVVVVLVGETFDEAYVEARRLEAQDGLTFVHPFDDPDVIAGQGTIGLEIVRQHASAIDAIFVPVGGGGLIAGLGAYVKYVRPDIKVIGVEPDDAPTLHHALAENARVSLRQVGIFADGVAVRQIGAEPFRLAREVVDEVILVSTDEICAAIKDIFDDTRSIAEPSGALGVAGLKKYAARSDADRNQHSPHDRRPRMGSLIAINSGANMNFDRLRHVAERADLGERKEALLAATIPERPGSFREFSSAIGNRNITEFNYRYSGQDEARVFLGVELTDGLEEQRRLIESLCAKGYQILDLSDNEMAKLHVRYMVGGHATDVANEILYRFEFPERRGALQRFLDGLALGWNISLFHYRNHGSDYGRVLVGMQVPTEERAAFEVYIRELGYVFAEESANPAYAMFLGTRA
ncbi:MAG: threonine ammonia-lyase, biosynthetic [Deltaproteobacteria bacterium]|nr:threonine ammonia-lyase, biosynthetic [Deltaproteobacteria bacterium]